MTVSSKEIQSTIENSYKAIVAEKLNLEGILVKIQDGASAALGEALDIEVKRGFMGELTDQVEVIFTERELTVVFHSDLEQSEQNLEIAEIDTFIRQYLDVEHSLEDLSYFTSK